MSSPSSFDSQPDAELGRLLREHLTGPEPDRFLARMGQVLARLPAARDSQWEVLARWATPGVLAAALLAGLLLGLELWQGLRTADPAQSELAAVPALPLQVPQRADGSVVYYTVLEAR